jgi:hypothetical protein
MFSDIMYSYLGTLVDNYGMKILVIHRQKIPLVLLRRCLAKEIPLCFKINLVWMGSLPLDRTFRFFAAPTCLWSQVFESGRI